MKIFVWRLDWYGLQEKDLKNLNKKIEVEIFFTFPPTKKLLPLTKAERKKFVKNYFQNLIQKTSSDYSLEEVMVRGEDTEMSRTIKAVINGVDLFRLMNSGAQINAIQVDKIRGLKQIKLPKLSEEHWFLVTALFVHQTKGKSTGKLPQSEEVYLVFAKSQAEAERKARREFKNEEEPYVGWDYEIVRRKFVKISDTKIVFSENGMFDKKQLNFVLFRNLPDAKITPATAWK